MPPFYVGAYDAEDGKTGMDVPKLREVCHTRSEQAVFRNLFRKDAQSMLLLISAVCGGVFVTH